MPVGHPAFHGMHSGAAAVVLKAASGSLAFASASTLRDRITFAATATTIWISFAAWVDKGLGASTRVLPFALFASFGRRR